MRSRVFLPGSTIGIIGGGQLGRMLALEARRMDYHTLILDPDPDAPAAQVTDGHIVAPLTDLAAARELAARSDVVTLEWENADVRAVQALVQDVPVHPGSWVLEVAQNRLREKETAVALGLDTAPFRPVRSLEELRAGLAALGTPAILKTVTGGYDGRGQRRLDHPDEAVAAFAELQGGERDLILEGWVEFELEVSVICARSQAGEVVCFPVGQNVHSNGILDLTLVPAPLTEETRRKALAAGTRLIEGLNMVGLLAVELFVGWGGEVLVNEIAPRPHNSGHYTIEACSISQFELQLRAVCGLPLQEPVLLRPAAMANLLGEHVGDGRGLPSTLAALSLPQVALHLYGKKEGRRGRKMGHLTVLAADGENAQAAAATATRARDLLSAGLPDITFSVSGADTP